MSKRIKKVSMKLMALMLAIVTVLTMLPLNGFVFQPETAEAATGNTYRDLAKQVNRLVPIETYAMPADRAARIYAYSKPTVHWWQKQSSYYVDTFQEKIVILKMSDDGKAVLVVYLNGAECIKKDKTVASGDVISVRKKGKFKISGISGKTKKDRIKLEVLKYK